MGSRWAARVIFIAILLVVLMDGAFPDVLSGVDLDGWDKSVHFAGYFSLAFFGALGWPNWRVGFLLGLPLIGVGAEAMQQSTPDRTFDWADAVANGAGVGLAVALSFVITGWLGRSDSARK